MVQQQQEHEQPEFQDLCTAETEILNIVMDLVDQSLIDSLMTAINIRDWEQELRALDALENDMAGLSLGGWSQGASLEDMSAEFEAEVSLEDDWLEDIGWDAEIGAMLATGGRQN